MHNRLSSRLKPATPRLNHQQSTTSTPRHSNINNTGDNIAVENQQLSTSATLCQDTNNQSFKVLNEIMHSLILNAIQLYHVKHQLHADLSFTNNERTRLEEFMSIFTLPKWLLVVNALLDALHNQPSLFWSNLQTRLLQSESAIALGYYSLPLTDISALYRLLEQSSYNSFAIVQQTISKCLHLEFFHHPQYESRPFQQFQQQQQQQQSQNHQSQQPEEQDQHVTTNVTNSNNNLLDFGASPILQRQNRRAYEPMTPSYSNVQHDLSSQPPITPTRPTTTTTTTTTVPNVGFHETPNRFTRGHSTPGRISLRQPIQSNKSSLLLQQQQQQQQQHPKQEQTSSPSSFPQESDPISNLDSLPPLPLPTVTSHDDETISTQNHKPYTPNNKPFQQQQQYIYQPQLPQRNPLGLQSPIRRHTNSLFTPSLHSTTAPSPATNDDELHSFNYSNNITPYNQLSTPPTLNQTNVAIQYHQSTKNNMVTVYGFKQSDHQQIIQAFSTCGSIRTAQFVKPISQQHSTAQHTLGRVVIEFDSPGGANNALSKHCVINGYLIACIPFNPHHLNNLTVISTINLPYDALLATQQGINNNNNNHVNNPSQVFKHIYDETRQRLNDEQFSKQLHDILKYSFIVLILILFCMKMF